MAHCVCVCVLFFPPPFWDGCVGCGCVRLCISVSLCVLSLCLCMCVCVCLLESACFKVGFLVHRKETSPILPTRFPYPGFPEVSRFPGFEHHLLPNILGEFPYPKGHDPMHTPGPSNGEPRPIPQGPLKITSFQGTKTQSRPLG